MKIEDVTKLTPVEQFLYWVGERHKIYLRRQQGQYPPWTDDFILQTNYFTNPYRENDKTTVWYRENIRNPRRDDPSVIFATVAFRWFNWPATGEILLDHGWLDNWDEQAVVKSLGEFRDHGEKIFTGAFMINSPAGEPKLEAISRRISRVWNDRENLLTLARNWTSMEQAHKHLTRYDGLGGFMAYEIVCDLRYTKWLENATDKSTWSNPGPGAVRGLMRVFGREITNKSNSTSPATPKDYQERTAELLELLRMTYPTMPPFEMREVEMSLCEVDKYIRLLKGEGRSKRTYNGR